MADIFREVDEDIRRERYSKLWKRYGIVVIAAAVLIVVGTASVVGWREYSRSVREAEGNRFAEALYLVRSDNLAAAANAFAAIADDSGAGYSALARLQEAAALNDSGNRAAAIDAYDRLVADRSADPLLRDLASLFAVLHAFDSADVAELDERLLPLVGDNKPLRYSARELQAFVAYKGGNLEDAKTKLRALIDDAEAPPGIRQRASEFLAAVGGGN